ncbi:Phosphoglucomutase-2 [Coelomomyces lativittatus]|nr:Phosphoglucomutase-2 [Coelomomyces lativittatus]
MVGQNGILSTPAASHLIRKYKALGGILLTASHNPGGPENDFGIKFNTDNGGPAPERITDQIYEISKTLTSYQMADLPEIPLDQIQSLTLSPQFKVQIIDPVSDYVTLMKDIFDFKSISKWIQTHPDFKFLFDAMHGGTYS